MSNLPLPNQVIDLFCESIARQPMRAIQIESASGQLQGGILIVRGERDFALLCQFLTKPKTEAEVLAAVPEGRAA